MAVSLAELNTWNSQARIDTSSMLTGYESLQSFHLQMYDDLLADGNSEIFLERLNSWQLVLQAQKHQALFTRENQVVVYYKHYGITCPHLDGSAEFYARQTWLHERAHQRVADNWKVRSAIRLTWLQNELGEYLTQPWLQTNIYDQAEIAKSGQLLLFMGELLKAPTLSGVGYPTEDEIAEKLLRKALS